MSAEEICDAIMALEAKQCQLLAPEIKCRDEHGVWLELKANPPIESEE